MLAYMMARKSKHVMPDRTYSLRSWIDPRVEIRPSPISGLGMFAREPIRAGEVVIIWGGVVLTKDDIRAGNFRSGTLSAIADDLWLGGPPDDEDYEADYTNHSCDPNLWMGDEATLTAKRGIEVGEEITADYMMWEADEGYRAPWRCHCDSRLCRGDITGRDWRLPELRERYRGHFSPFLNKRIEGEGGVSGGRI
jgi:uncharacterized protein